MVMVYLLVTRGPDLIAKRKRDYHVKDVESFNEAIMRANR